MLDEILLIETTISELERTLPNLSDVSIFEQLFELRQRAFSGWVEEDPESITADPATELRDRITNIEQRLMNLAAIIPASSIANIQLKLKLWLLFKDLPGVNWQQGDISDDLIVSVFRDLTRAKTRINAPNAPPYLKSVC